MGGASKLLMLLATPFPLLSRCPAALRLAAAASRLAPSASRHRPGFALRTTKLIHTRASAREALGELAGSPADFRVSSPWPEWSKLVNNLVTGGYSSRRASGEDEDSFLSYEGLSEAFVKASEVFLSFARDRPDLLRLLSKKDIEVIVENRSPYLFKNGGDSSRRMQLFLSGGEIDVLESERAQTVDLVRYLLSYTCNRLLTLDMSNMKATERTEASVQNLLNELINFSAPVRESNLNESTSGQLPMGHEQLSRPRGQNIEMKRGDWICLKCSFMNFARNARCLECNEGRPKRQLTGGEWECPQCDFFNYGRNMSCLRCDCKRPGESATSGFSGSQILNGSNTDKSEIERRLAANDEKAERWFSKVSQLDDSADLSRAAADEDFPEIMPLRKGVNRFVVSTRKTPLERRLAEAQYRNNSVDGNDSESRGSSETTAESSISQSLDRILGRSGTNNQAAAGETNTGGGSRFNLSNLRQSAANQKSDPNYVPFVPLPADMFSKSKHTGLEQSPDSQLTDSATVSDSSEGWLKKAAEHDSVADLADALPGDDFPEIMPMRKGENRFVVSKKKDRSLTSPQYKRRLAMEQANSSSFVPFVPFPPDYFAKKDKQPEDSPVTVSSPTDSKPVDSKMRSESWSDSSQNSAGTKMNSVYKSPPTNPAPSSAWNGPDASRTNQPNDGWKKSSGPDGWKTSSASNGPDASGSSGNRDDWKNNSTRGVSQPAENPQSSSWKSLEGSAVKETDPLDMSEEAKTERWFRRVAQIKDISELSQIPDEDFPEIMPMRKGVNRFVVSKRKTPLERRLTSPQYRRNLPIVSSEPDKDT